MMSISKIVNGLLPRKSVKSTHDYWRLPNHANNKAELYLIGNEKSKFLYKLIDEHLPDRSARILEIGCNVGRNLNYLFDKGYTNLTGVEISSYALQVMKNTFAKLADIRIFNSPIESQIGKFSDDEFDVVFTMAVLVHIHKDSEFIFEEMARITKRFLVTIEIEKGLGIKNFQRNYGKIFSKFGLREIKTIDCKNIDGFGKSNIVCRVFEKR